MTAPSWVEETSSPGNAYPPPRDVRALIGRFIPSIADVLFQPSVGLRSARSCLAQSPQAWNVTWMSWVKDGARARGGRARSRLLRDRLKTGWRFEAVHDSSF